MFLPDKAFFFGGGALFPRIPFLSVFFPSSWNEDLSWRARSGDDASGNVMAFSSNLEGHLRTSRFPFSLLRPYLFR